MSSLNRRLILVAMALQALIVCGDFMQPAELEPAGPRDVAHDPPTTQERPLPYGHAPFVACHDREAR